MAHFMTEAQRLCVCDEGTGVSTLWGLKTPQAHDPTPAGSWVDTWRGLQGVLGVPRRAPSSLAGLEG